MNDTGFSTGSLWPFTAPVLALLATVAWWKRRAAAEHPHPYAAASASQQLAPTELGWCDLPDELIARIATHVPRHDLSRLALVERRCRHPSAAQLHGQRARWLHDLVRAGDVDRISHLFHEEHGGVMLLLEGHTILHTAIEARQLGVIEWLVRPLSQYNKPAPLSSNIISFPRYHVQDDTIVPAALPKEYCERLFVADGLAALRNAATRGDVELINCLLPIHMVYFPSLDFTMEGLPVTRELMVDLRARLRQAFSDFMVDHEEPLHEDDIDFADVNRAVYVIDRRVRCSDIWLTFHSASIQKLDAVFTGPAFDWLNPDDEYLSMEQYEVNRALHVTVAAGRADLTAWLMDEWGAEHDDRPHGQALAEHTIFEHSYNFKGLFKCRDVSEEYEHQRRGQQRWEGVLTRWARHHSPTNHWGPPGAPCNSAALNTLIAAALTEESCMSTSDRLKQGLLLAETSAPGHPAMLTFLADRLGGAGLPRLSVIVAGGAIWALEWLFNSGRITLEMDIGDVPAELTAGLTEQVWLTENLTVGVVLASLCVTHGAIAMLEMLNSRGINLRTVYGDLTLMHIAARGVQAVSILWLVENGYEDLLCVIAAGMTPLHEAVRAGDTFILNYLLEHGAGAADCPNGANWVTLAISSEREDVQAIGRKFSSMQALETTLPGMLRSNALLTDIQELVDAHAVAQYARDAVPCLRAVLQAAIEGGRQDFLRWMYTCPDVFGADFCRFVGCEHLEEEPYIREYSHDKLCRELAECHGGSELSSLLALFDELAAAADDIGQSKSELHDLDLQITNLFVQGGTVAELKEWVSNVRQLLAAAPSPDVGEHRTMVHGLSVRINSSHQPRFTVRVGRIGDFGALAACALFGHLHLVEWFLRAADEPATVEQAADALATSLEWGGPTSVVELLCRRLQESGFDLNAVQCTADPGYPSLGRAHGTMECALLGITRSALFYARHAAGLPPGPLSEVEAVDAQKREQLSWANAAWLASHTGARLGSKSFAKILCSYHFDPRGHDEMNSFVMQSFVLQLTKLCIEKLGASWSDSSQQGRDERELTALQLLVNGCWMDAVQWLAKERNAPLHGLVIEVRHRFAATSDRYEPFRATLRTLQEEQRRAWAGMGGDVTDKE